MRTAHYKVISWGYGIDVLRQRRIIGRRVHVRRDEALHAAYYLRSQQGLIWMLTLYAKNEAASIPGHVLKQMKEELDGQG
jgi:hypothetical protein